MATPKPEGSVVPKNYEELQRHYGDHVRNLLNRYNKVERNLEDLHGYIWVKILEAKLLERFQDYVSRQVPRVITGLQATDLLGISWKQWIAAQRGYHQKGVGWMPTPINDLEFKASGVDGWASKEALYSLVDVFQLTIERHIGHSFRLPFRIMGRHVKDGEIVGGERPEGYLKIPELRVTGSQFRNYLTMAVLNHYANFCRTLDRRHKERPPVQRAGREDAPIWESTLVDSSQASPETRAALNEARQIITSALQQHSKDPQVTESVEDVIFSRLSDGSSLLQALKEAQIPPRVRKAVVRALRPYVKSL